MALSDNTPAHLERGESVVGHAWLEGSDEQVPVVLEWSEEVGARLTLVEPTHAWGEVGDGPIVIHMQAHVGERFTLLDAHAVHGSFADSVAVLHARTLGLGAHVTPAEQWSRAEYSTANLIEWREETGLTVSSDMDVLRIEWRSPDEIKVVLPGAAMELSAGRQQHTNAFDSAWSIETSHAAHVKVERPLTIDEMHRHYAQPLLAFTSFALDKPDSITRELLTNPALKKAALTWRAGEHVRPRPWHHSHGFLFRFSQIKDPAEALRKWWELHEETWPALGLFAQHVNDGPNYSPARLITLHTALEAYGRTHLKTEDFKKLRDIGLDAATAQELIAAHYRNWPIP